MKPKRRFINFLAGTATLSAVLVMSFASTSGAFAASLTWDASGVATSTPADGAGTWNTSSINWNNGAADVVWPNTSADIAVFGAGNGAAGAVTVGTVNANGINFNSPGSGNYLLSSGTITLAGTTPTITTRSGVLPSVGSTLAGSAGLISNGLGTLTLTGSNTFTGGLTVNSGTLDLGGATANGSIDSSNVLTLGGAALNYTRTGGTTQTFASTTTSAPVAGTNSGYNVISAVAGDTLALGAIIHGTGSIIDFGTTGSITTTNGNTNDILGGWATTGVTGGSNTTGDWVCNNGSGTITTYAGYTAISSGAGSSQTGAGASTQNWKCGDLNGTNRITTLTASATVNSLVFQGDFGVNNGCTLTVGSGGMIMKGQARWILNNNAGSVTGTGVIKSGLSTGELYLHVPSSTASNWTVWPVIADGSVASQVVKSGAGLLFLQNYNTYTGGTTVNAGTLNLVHAANSGTGTIRGVLNVNPGAQAIFSGTNPNTMGYTVGAKITTVNINGGTVSTSVAGDQGFNNVWNLTGGTISSNGGTASTTATSFFVFASDTVANGAANAINTFASPSSSTIAGRIHIRNDNSQTTMPITVADGPASTDLLVSASITSGGAMGITKKGLGTMSLTGPNTYSGTTSIDAGTVLFSGSSTASAIAVGTAGGSAGAMYHTAGAITTGSGGLRIGQAPGAFGYYKLSGGSVTLPAGGEVDPGGSAGGAGTFGQFDMVGGTVGGGDYLLPNRGAAGSSSVTNILGGTFTIPSTVADGNFNGLAANWQNTGAAQTAAITIGGSGQFISPSVRVKLNEGSSFNGTSGNNLNVTSLNLTGGGLLQTKGFLNGVGNNPNVSINFNNGTLKAGNAGNATFLSDLGSVNIYSGNAIIDNNSQAISIAQPFMGATGTGVSSVPVTSAGSGYVTPPQVTFTGGTVTGGTGSGATGYATIDSTGKLTSIVVTNPGTYSDTTGLSVAINGGGGTGASLGSITTAANTSGGMTFTGSGVTTLTGASTYTGATTVNGGTLQLSGSGSLNNSSGITVNGSGTKLVQTSGTTMTPVVTLTQGTVDGYGSIDTLNVANSSANTVTAGTGTFGTLTIGSLAFSGAANVNLRLSGSSVDTSLETTSLSTNAAGTVTVNLTNTGAWSVGTYPLISYSGSIGGAGFSKFTLAPLAGLGGRQNAQLINTDSAVALSIGGDSPVWTGLQSGAWTTTAIAGSKNWKLLVGGGTTDFLTNDIVLFDDSASGTTAITINDATVSPISTTFDNSALNYSLSGSNGIKTGTLTKSGSGDLVINTANTYSGTTSLNGGMLHLNNASAIGTGMLVINGGSIDNTSGSPVTLSTNNAQTWNSDIAFGGTNNLNLGTGAVTLGASQNVTTTGSSVLTVGGVVSGTGFGITKFGAGTLTLSGANAYTGATMVSEGILNLTGSAGLTGALFVNGGGTLVLNGTLGASTVNGTFIVGQGSGAGILKIPTGTSITRANLYLGDAAGITGAVYQSGGSLTLTQGAGVDNLRIGSATSGNGYYNLSGGTLAANEINVGGSQNDTVGVMDVSAGTVTSNGWMVLGRGGAASSGNLNVTGGTVNFGATTANPLSINWAGTSGASSVVNVGGGAGAASLTGASSTATGKGLILASANTAGTSGIVNLLANGTLTVSEVVAGNANPTTLLNFNGGTLAATAASRGALFMPGTNVDGVYVYGGGGTINNSGTNITIGSTLLAPTVGSGNGVNGIASFTGGAGYIGAPLVQVVNHPSDTTGVGATAVASINPATGQVTGITITNPGVGYTATPTFVLSGGGATTAATVTGTAPSANSSGGMNFSGAGKTTLTGANTYTGGSTVNGGTLQITDDSQFGAVPASPSVNITLKGGTLYNNDSTPVINANRTIALDASGGYLQAGWTPKTLTVNGLITGVGGLGINWDSGAIVLAAVNNYGGNTSIGVAGPSFWADAAANPILKLAIDDAIPYGSGKGNVIFGTSANSNTATLDLNGHNTRINGLTGGSNANIDNTTGAGTYLLTAGDNDQTSTFGGVMKNTAGTLALNKTGSGTLTLTGASTYTGNTTVNNGTLIANRSNNILNPVSSAIGNNQVAHTVTVNNGATLQFSSGDTMGSATSTFATTLVVNAGGTVTNGGGVFNRLGSVTLNGGTLTSVSGAIAGYQTYSFDANAVVTVGGSSASTISANGTFNGIHLNTNTVFNVADATGSSAADLTVSAPLIDRNQSEIAAGGLTKSGAGTLTLTGANTYTGKTTVNGGRLAISSAYLADAADVSIAVGASMALNFAGTDTIDELVIDGAAKSPGTYGATGSGATYIDDTHFAGSGTLTVTTGPTSGGFASWISNPSFGLTAADQDATDDPDGDGFNNLMEYVLGGNPGSNNSTIAPVGSKSGSNFIVTFSRNDLAVSGGDVSILLDYGSDLAGWTSVAVPASNSTVSGVSFNITDGSPSDTVTATIPTSSAVKFFARVKAVK